MNKLNKMTVRERVNDTTVPIPNNFYPYFLRVEIAANIKKAKTSNIPALMKLKTLLTYREILD